MFNINLMLRKFFLSNCIEAGTDEAGRGHISGPISAAAVILPYNYLTILNYFPRKIGLHYDLLL